MLVGRGVGVGLTVGTGVGLGFKVGVGLGVKVGAGGLVGDGVSVGGIGELVGAGSDVGVGAASTRGGVAVTVSADAGYGVAVAESAMVDPGAVGGTGPGSEAVHAIPALMRTRTVADSIRMSDTGWLCIEYPPAATMWHHTRIARL